MQKIVTKFGGTSVSSLETWENITKITLQHIKAGFQPIIVCSAYTQVSNKLEQAINAALLNQHGTIQDDILQKYQDLADVLQVPINLIDEEAKKLDQLLMGIALLKEAPAKTRDSNFKSWRINDDSIRTLFFKKARY